MPLQVAAMTPDQAVAITRWRYEGPWSVYNGTWPPPEPADGYVAVVDPDASDIAAGFVGFACFGGQARVRGLPAEPGVLDVGFGMCPDLVGQGRGRSLLAVVLAHARETTEGTEFRVVVQSWSARSRRLVEAAGFVASGSLVVHQFGEPVAYTVLRRAW